MVLAALVWAHREVFAQSLFVLQALTANRWSPRGMSSAAKLFMQGLVVLDVGRDMGTVPEGLRAAQNALMRSARMAYADPLRTQDLIADSEVAEIPGVVGMYYNFASSDTLSIAESEAVAGPVDQRGLAGLGPGIAYTVEHGRSGLSISIRHAPRTVSVIDGKEILQHTLHVLQDLVRRPQPR
jgi:hypothetical protein